MAVITKTLSFKSRKTKCDNSWSKFNKSHLRKSRLKTQESNTQRFKPKLTSCYPRARKVSRFLSTKKRFSTSNNNWSQDNWTPTCCMKVSTNNNIIIPNCLKLTKALWESWSNLLWASNSLREEVIRRLKIIWVTLLESWGSSQL